MRADEFERLADLFERVRALDDAGRLALLEDETAGDPRLRAELERLLALHETEDRTFEGFGAAARGLLRDLADADVPRRVGPYRILRELGAGGMGVVYLAEQEEPLRRQVALKIIRPGMDSREIVARFELERQAVARMAHPSIAQVYDAGTTGDGRPYFALEYVDGEPITEWCDTRRLDTAARITLFREVCAAVEHAHQRGIIHRDLKPSNVLVTEIDGKPVPKVIDFGIARAVDDPGGGTLWTELGRMIGTPAYMSPEQALTGSVDLDTRTDIYSLGVLLYQLLVGETPLDPATLRRAGHAELQRILTQEEPRRPSVRARELGRLTSDHARARQVDPESLVRRLRGDLDWITMRALEHDRSRRYPSAGAFARDLERFLRDEPVEARPPSRAYRLSKFVRRHRGPVLAASLVLATLVAGLLVSTGLYVEAEEARALAERRLATVQRHADLQLCAELEAEADVLWPMRPERERDLIAWLERADALLARLPGHRARRDALRARGRRAAPPVDDESGRAIDRLRRERRAKTRELGKFRPATRLPLAAGGQGLPLTTWLRHDLVLEAPPATGTCTFRLHCFDGAALTLNGEEIGRWNLPQGPLTPETPASGPSPQFVIHGRFPASLLRRGRNALAAEVHLQSRDRDRIQLAFDAVDPAGEVLVEVDALWSYAPPGTLPPATWRDPSVDPEWPRGPMPIGLSRQSELPERFRLAVEHLERELARIDRELAPLLTARMRREHWTFPSRSDQEEHDELDRLVGRLEALRRSEPPGLVVEIRRRLQEASTLRARTVDAYRDVWLRAAAEVAASPVYAGLHLEPQTGLVPLGADVDSGLHEFAHVATGRPPSRDADGRLVLSDDGGLVLVLVPGGRFRMGAVRPGSGLEAGAPNVDPGARRSEYPVHEVELAPYFLSRYEMTQGQWLRLTGTNPSTWPIGSQAASHVVGHQNPVESLTWEVARRGLHRVGLLLPTEAQWEHAARAGTTTPWWTGAEPSSLAGALNIADLSAVRNQEGWAEKAWRELDDGYVVHAPRGTFRPNPWGFSELLGNVREWCLDPFGSYEAPVRPGDGRRLELFDPELFVTRGGSYSSRLEASRVAHRGSTKAQLAETWVGVRPARALDPATRVGR